MDIPLIDRGCAVAAEFGVMAGADRVEGTLFGRNFVAYNLLPNATRERQFDDDGEEAEDVGEKEKAGEEQAGEEHDKWVTEQLSSLQREDKPGLCVEPDAFELQLRREHGMRLFENPSSPSKLPFNDLVRKGLCHILARADPKPYASATEKLNAQAEKTKERMVSYLADDDPYCRENYLYLKGLFDRGTSKAMSVIMAVRMFIDIKNSNEEDPNFNWWAEFTAKGQPPLVYAQFKLVRREMGDAW